MALFSSTINSSNIKFRFAEKYSSSAANIQTGINLPGVYRGAEILESAGGADTSFRIAVGPENDSLILHQNTTNGIATVVRVESNVIMDMSAQSWPIPSDIEWVVYMVVDYDDNVDTTGSFAVDIPANVPDDAVILAHIFMESGDTSILQSRIRIDGSYRDKVLGKKGILIRRKIEKTTSSATRFQLTGRISFVDQTYNWSGKVKFLSGIDSDSVLIGSNGGEIYAGSWYTQEIGGSAITLSDLDEDGCYTDPWISIVFFDVTETSLTGTFAVAYWEFVVLEDLDTAEAISTDPNLHSNNVFCKGNSSYADILYTGTLTNQIDSLLSMIHQRVRNPHPDSPPPPGGWTLIWRSNNAVFDVSVDEDTVSLYFSSEGFLVCKGGYMSGGANFYVNEAGNCTVIFIDDNRIYKMFKSFSSAPDSSDIYYDEAWDSWDKSEAGNVEFGTSNIQRIFEFIEWGTAQMAAIPDASGRDYRLEILRLADHIRIYYTSPSNAASFEIACGCYWDDSANLWRRVGTQNFDSTLYSFSRNSFVVFHKDRNDANWTTGWSSTDFSVSWVFADGNSFAPIKLTGPIEEEWDVDFKVVLVDDLIKAMGRYSGWEGVERGRKIYYRGQRIIVPSTGDFSISKKSGLNADIVVSAPTEWGFTAGGLVYLVDSLEGASIYELLSDRIKLIGWNLGIDPGSHICLKGDGVNEAWLVKEVYEFGGATNNTSCIVETNGGINNVPTSIGTKKAYYISNADLGSEISATYTIKLFG
jgi:hypothetical protein